MYTRDNMVSRQQFKSVEKDLPEIKESFVKLSAIKVFFANLLNKYNPLYSLSTAVKTERAALCSFPFNLIFIGTKE